jgi:hypothetical protein
MDRNLIARGVILSELAHFVERADFMSDHHV